MYLYILADILYSELMNYLYIFNPILLLLLALYLWCKFVSRSNDKRSALPLPPGSSGWPFIGETIPFLVNGRAYFRNRFNKYGSIYRTHLIGTPYIVICGSQNIAETVNCESSNLIGNTPSSAMKLFGEGALCCTLSLDIYKKKQKFIKSVFKHNVLEKMTISTQEMMDSTISKWIQQRNVLGVKEIERLILMNTFSSLLGLDLKPENEEQLINLFTIFKDNFFSIPIDLPGTSFRKAMKARKEILKIISVNVESQNFTEFSVVNIMINDKDTGMSKTEITNLALELLFGAYTTASACCALIIHLALNKDVLSRFRTEIHSKCQLGKDDFMSLSDLTKMEYLNDLVKEVLRISPPIAGGFRKAAETFEIGGYQIPKGWGVLYSITDTHERAESFAKNDPLTFSPDRWQELRNRERAACTEIFSDDHENKEWASLRNVSKFDYLPFGAGFKKCPGKEYGLLLLKVFAVVLCRSCEWTLDNGDQVPAMKTNPIPFPVDGMPITVSKLTP